MFNPLVDNFDALTDLEVDQKISELSRKYFQTRNPELQAQISVILDMFKQEARLRRERAFAKQQQENGDNSLDSLINIS